MRRNHQILALLILILLASLVYFMVPVGVNGIVEYKAIEGRMSGDIVEGILEIMPPHTDQPSIRIEKKELEHSISVDDNDIFISDSLHESLEGKYINVEYIVAVKIGSADPVNNVREGETYAYLVDRNDFNSVKIGDNVICKVSRHKKSTINRIIVRS
jgi:hypothetical protein